MAAPSVQASGWSALAIDSAAVECGQQLGSGGFSVVYKGSWCGTSIAVKKWYDSSATAEQRARIRQEVTTLAALRHPHIITCCGAGTEAGNSFMVTELMPFSLFTVLYQMPGITLQLPNCINIALDLCRALRYLHSRSPQVIHRDIKPSNVLLDRAWKVKLCDLGLAVSDTSGAGTPNYMAPELLAGSPFTDKVDVFAFAVLLNELLARKPPFAGMDAARVSELVQAGHRPDVPPMPQALSQLIKQCWHQDPQQRPSCVQIQESLGKLDTQSGASAA